jgi:glycine/D-amino acid oxidase-like deaminating enzyme
VGKLAKSFVHYGGYYTKTRENLPLIGPMQQDGATIPGAYLIGALSGFGTMAACAAGELVAAWVAGGGRPAYATAFSRARYDDNRSWLSSKSIGQGEL